MQLINKHFNNPTMPCALLRQGTTSDKAEPLAPFKRLLILGSYKTGSPSDLPSLSNDLKSMQGVDYGARW